MAPSPPVGRPIFEAGFESVPGGDAYRNRSVYSYHYYNPPNVGNMGAYLDLRVKDAARWGCGSMVTEFGIDNDGQDPQKFDQIIAV
jgi:endoglycosylceramidase